MQEVCRICLRPAKLLLSLFDDPQLSEKIRIISSITIEQQDGFPATVCADCIININMSYNFRLVIINSDLLLRKRATDKIVENEELTDTDNSESLLRISKMIKVELDDWEGQPRGHEEPVVKSIPKEVKEPVVESNAKEVKEPERESNTKEAEETILKRKLYQCNKCDFVTESLSSSFKHDRSVHGKARTRVCSICGKVLGVSNFNKHMRIHDATPSKCDVCGKICKNLEALRHHKFVHKGVKICEYCGKTFNHQSSYALHVKRFHEGGLKKLICSFCHKVFFQGNDLKRHLQRHTGERPHICEICERGFSSTHSLKTHKRQHTNERPYVCEACGIAFKQRVSLRHHLSTRHPGSGLTLN